MEILPFTATMQITQIDLILGLLFWDKKEKKVNKIFLTNQKRSMQVQATVHSWATPAKQPSVWLQKRSPKLWLSFDVPCSIWLDTHWRNLHIKTQCHWSNTAVKAIMQWNLPILLCDKAHTCVYFPHMIFLNNYNVIPTSMYADEL